MSTTIQGGGGYGNKNNPELEVEALECGTSLAEAEFCGVHIPTTTASTTIIDKTATHPFAKTPWQEEGSRRSEKNLSSINELRAVLAQDIITGTNTTAFHDDTDNENDESFPRLYSTFTSPFEAPPNSNNKNSHTNGNKQTHQLPKLHVPLVYCDHTASNRPVASVERYLQRECLPWYGNTHTNTSLTGSQSTALVAEARQIVAEACNAKITGKASLDVVLFTGNGATSAVELLIDCLGVRHAVANAAANDDEDSRPVVLVGPYEHHSNLIPWRESGCLVTIVPECAKTHTLDLRALEDLLQKYSRPSQSLQTRRLVMGAFSAASNVTGQLTNVSAVAALLHRYGALAFVDYATAAPYCTVNMNPSSSNSYDGSTVMETDDISLDAIFWSPHKLLGGGAGTPGVLIVKKRWVSQVNAPHRSGGGTVFYVTDTHHRFLSHRVERYEGGTPPVVGIWRLGLCLLLKRRLEQEYQQLVATTLQSEQPRHDQSCINEQLPSRQGETNIPATIHEFDLQTYRQVARYLAIHAPNLVLLGNHDLQSTTEKSRKNNLQQAQHLPIFSFLIRWGPRFLHFNYVCAVLNDLFGIQSRGGCQCAGPYSQRLLGLTRLAADNGSSNSSKTVNEEVEEALVQYKERAELLRPGYTRLSLPFKGLTSDEVDYVVQALVWVSKHAWALLCQYRCNHRTGEWRHSARQGKPLGKEERRWLSHYQPLKLQQQLQEQPTQPPVTTAMTSTTPSPPRKEIPSFKEVLDRSLLQADEVLQAAVKDQRNIAQSIKMADAESVLGDDGSLERLRWYVYPKECALHLTQYGLDGGAADYSKVLLLGAINPFLTDGKAFVTSSDEQQQLSTGVPYKTDISTFDKKRKIDVGDGVDSRNNIDDLGVIPFRDGEYHQGEADINEIEERIADGELSDQAEVFDSRTGEWVNATEFLSAAKKPKSLEIKQELKLQNTTVSQTKKAPRDHSMWGKGEVAGVPSTAAAAPPNNGGANEKESPLPAINNDTDKNRPSIGNGKQRTKHIKPPPKLMRLVTQAVFQWDMIQEGDRLLLGLSGGKDSLSLLHCLLELQRKLPTKFEIEVCTIDPMTPSFDPSPLIPYVEQTLGLKYYYIRDDIVARAASAGKDGSMVSSLCAFCARMKRGNLYSAARQNRCNKLVLAQHLDDCAESFLMSVMHNGFLRTMKANYEINAGDLSVIRPMVFCRESLMTEFAKQAKLPVINENCPACFEEPKERARVKKLLSREELNYPNFYDNIRRSLLPLMHPLSESVMHSFAEEALARSRKKGNSSNKRPKTALNVVSSGADDTANGLSVATAASVKTADGVTGQYSGNNVTTQPTALSAFSDEQLMAELALRKAARFRLAGAMKSNNGISNKDDKQLSDAERFACSTDKMLCEVGGACSLFD
ncbi:hypothetical protein ACA910_006790 [Epithemia clementina (nom. ined.)]